MKLKQAIISSFYLLKERNDTEVPKKKINKNKNGEIVPNLEITEVVLVHRNIVSNGYKRDSRFLPTLHLFQTNH